MTPGALALYEEVHRVYNLHCPEELPTGQQLMDALNATHLVLARGYEVQASHLVAAIVAAGTWQNAQSKPSTISPNTFGLSPASQAQ